MSKIKLALVLILSSFSGIFARAADEGVSYAIHHLYQSPRALGMGDAFIAVANDYNAILYNPAALAFRDNGEMNFSMEFGVSSAFGSFAKDIIDASNSGTTDSEKQNNVAAAIMNQYGKTFSGRMAPASGVWVRPNWGIAVIPMDLSVSMTPNNPVIINSTVYMDSTIAASYAEPVKSIENAKVSWGVTGKIVNRGYFSKAISGIELAADPNLVKSSDFKEGYFIDADLGLLYQPHIPDEGWMKAFRLARPTFGAVVRNVIGGEAMGTLKLFNKNNSEKPEKLFRVIDLGSRWEYPELWIFKGRGTLDIRDILHPRFSMKKGLHVGFEFDWTMASWWKGNYRVGYSQGYVTAGLSALFSIFNLDLVTYGEDVGTYNTASENRVYMLKANINL